MRRLALILVPLTLAACQPKAQNTAAPAALPAPAAAPVTPAAQPPAAPPKTAADYRADLNLTGTEPFWGVQIRKDRITLTRPDHPDINTRNPGVSISAETASWNAGEMMITLEPADCSDGMSDRQYPYAAQVKVGDEVLKGCAYNPAKPPPMPH